MWRNGHLPNRVHSRQLLPNKGSCRDTMPVRLLHRNNRADYMPRVHCWHFLRQHWIQLTLFVHYRLCVPSGVCKKRDLPIRV